MLSRRSRPVLVARTLGPFDLVVIFVAIVLFINNSAGLQFAGPSVFIFWIVAFVTFLITGAFVTAQLGRMFPEEGSLYVWTHKVLGPFWGFFAGFVAWWPGPISLVFIGLLFANFLQQFAVFIRPSCEFPCLFTENWQIGVVVLARDLVQRADVLPEDARHAELRERAVLVLRGGDLPDRVRRGVVAAAGQRLVHGLRDGMGPLPGETLALGLPANLTFFSFAILALLGIETPLNMGAEVTGGEKAIRTFLLWGCLIVMAAYLWATWGNMVVIEAGGCERDHRGSRDGRARAREVEPAPPSSWCGWFVLTVAVVYNYSFGRLLFVSGMEKRLPHQIGKVNRNKVPANAITLQSGDLDDPRGHRSSSSSAVGESDPYRYFYALYAGVTIVWCISTALLFLDIFFAKRAEPGAVRGATGAVPARLPVPLRRRRARRQRPAAALFIFIGSWYAAGFDRPSTEWNAWIVPASRSSR